MVLLNPGEINPDDIEDYITSNTDIFDLDLIQFEEGEAKSRKTTLRSTLNLGAEITLLNNKLGFGVLSSTQFTLPKSYSELTVSANYRPRNWFGATLSYSFLHSEFKTVGIGLKLGPIFIGSDYLMTKARVMPTVLTPISDAASLSVKNEWITADKSNGGVSKHTS